VSTAALAQRLYGAEMGLGIIYVIKSFYGNETQFYGNFEPLGNACGLYHKMNGMNRPLIKPSRRMVFTFIK
jgi:hypothetical protein